MTVIGYEINISSNDCTQVFAKSNIHRRAMVQCTDTHIQYMLRCFGCFICQSLYQVGMQFSLLQYASAIGAIRSRSAIRLLYILRKASNIAATRIEPLSCGFHNRPVFITRRFFGLPLFGCRINTTDGITRGNCIRR